MLKETGLDGSAGSAILDHNCGKANQDEPQRADLVLLQKSERLKFHLPLTCL